MAGFAAVELAGVGVRLRGFGAGDAEETRRICDDPSTRRWLPLPSPYTLSHAVDWCTVSSHAQRESGAGIHFAVAETGTDRLLGALGVRHVDWRVRSAEVGYWIAPWERGRGLATTAVRLAAAWLLDEQGFQRVQLKAAFGNTASRRVAEKAGFRREGVLRNAGLTDDGPTDLVLYSLVPDDLPG